MDIVEGLRGWVQQSPRELAEHALSRANVKLVRRPHLLPHIEQSINAAIQQERAYVDSLRKERDAWKSKCESAWQRADEAFFHPRERAQLKAERDALREVLGQFVDAADAGYMETSKFEAAIARARAAIAAATGRET